MSPNFLLTSNSVGGPNYIAFIFVTIAQDIMVTAPTSGYHEVIKLNSLIFILQFSDFFRFFFSQTVSIQVSSTTGLTAERVSTDQNGFPSEEEPRRHIHILG